MALEITEGLGVRYLSRSTHSGRGQHEFWVNLRVKVREWISARERKGVRDCVHQVDHSIAQGGNRHLVFSIRVSVRFTG